jgi:hypothetical protein
MSTETLNPHVFPNVRPTTRRLAILRRAVEALSRIQEGLPAFQVGSADGRLENGAGHVFLSTVRKVLLTHVPAIDMPPEELPCINLVIEEPTLFEGDNDADGWSSEANWSVALYLTVAANGDEPERSIAIVQALEELLQDSIVAILSDFNLGGGSSVTATIGNFVPDPFSDPTIGRGAVSCTFHYSHLFFDPTA